MTTHKSTTRAQDNNFANKAQHTASETASAVGSGTKSARDFVKKFYHDWSLHLTQALTFGLVTSLIPLGMLLVAIVGQIIGTLNKSAQQQFLNHLKSVFPPQLLPAEITASSANKLLASSGIWITVSIIAALFFGSRLFTLLEACFDIIYHVPPRPQKEKNLRAIVMVIVFMILTPLLALASIIPGQVISLIQNTPLSTAVDPVHKVIGTISSLIVSFLLFEIIYTFVPNRGGRVKARLRSSLRGSITAAIVLQIGLLIFPLYANTYSKGIVTQIAFALVFLIFFYIISLVTLIGAEVNAYFADNIPAPSADLVTRASRTH